MLFYEAGLWRTLASPSKIHKSVAETQWRIDSVYPSNEGYLSRPKYIYCWENSTKTVQAERLERRPSVQCNLNLSLLGPEVQKNPRIRHYIITLHYIITNYPKHCKQWLLSCPSTISVVLISVIIYNCLLSIACSIVTLKYQTLKYTHLALYLDNKICKQHLQVACK